jgi:hypothetical protein
MQEAPGLANGLSSWPIATIITVGWNVLAVAPAPDRACLRDPHNDQHPICGMAAITLFSMPVDSAWSNSTL